MKAQMGTGRVIGGNQFLKERQNPSLRGMCTGRENRGSSSIGEAPDSVRGLARAQYPSRVNKKIRMLVGGIGGHKEDS